MATHLDLEEQEQLDQLKHFWNRWGNLVMAVVTVALLAYAGWNGWQWYQRDQSAKAAMLFDELQRAADAADVGKAQQVFGDLKSGFGRTTWAEQGGLLTAKVLHAQGKGEDARKVLEWVAAEAPEHEYRWVARLRLAGLLMDAKDADGALKQLDGEAPASFAGLIADRRGDILAGKGQRDDAIKAYQLALAKLEAGLDYRQLVEAKLKALGADAVVPAPAAAASAASGAAR